MDRWMDGWMDGWTDGWIKCKHWVIEFYII